MTTNNITLETLQANTFQLEKTSSKTNLSELCTERQCPYLKEFTLFDCSIQPCSKLYLRKEQ